VERQAGGPPHGYPPPPRPRRPGMMGITVVFLAVLGLVLGAIGIREALLRSLAMPATNNKKSTPKLLTRHEPEDVLVIVTDYLLRSGTTAASTATERGLEPLVIGTNGAEINPEDRALCRITRIEPQAGWVPAGSLLELTCEEVS
jgi:hypothetical protein